ncbi:hypothetical protein JCM10908_000768 [Rhodotorula pacifica]|uniref:uncharacterized protein n=1 Tax=Rhodotorula pacifica TaxID=1495444 RepID=UPI003177BCEC
MSSPINLRAPTLEQDEDYGEYSAAAATAGKSPRSFGGSWGQPSQFGTPSRSSRASKGKGKEAYGSVPLFALEVCKLTEEVCRSSPIGSVPLEIIAHIFAQLPPASLGTCQLVCKPWHDVVVDEGSWRTAFETYYDVTPLTLGRRIEPTSWRSEYIARVSLLRQWHRARTPTLIHNPSLGAINYMHVHLPAASSLPASSSGARTPNGLHTAPSSSSVDPPSLTATPMLSVSLAMGAAVHSSPFTGKVSKRPLVASPVDHLDRPVGGLPLVATTSFAVSNDGTRLVWGMRDGSLRFSNSAPLGGGRGIAGGSVEQGEVRSVDEAHRAGSTVQLVAFSNLAGGGAGKVLRNAAKQRQEVFVTAGADGVVAIWTLAAAAVAAAGGGGARERPPPAVKLWQARWDIALDAAPSAPANGHAGPSPLDGAGSARRVKATAIVCDSGWTGRHHGRLASVAIGRCDGKVVVWREIDLDGATTSAVVRAEEDEATLIAPLESGRAVDTLIMDLPTTNNATTSGVSSTLSSSQTAQVSLLVHQADSTRFCRFNLEAATISRTVFGHPDIGGGKEDLAPLTAFAVDFDDPPPVPASGPATPAEGRIAFPLRPSGLSNALSSASMPSLSRSSSVTSLPPFQPVSHEVGSRFGRRKYVATGDAQGRVYLWDWETKHAEGEEDKIKEGVVGPAAMIQVLEIDGGSSASKVTALELTEAGVFVGGLDGTLRFYSTLGTSHLVQPPIRSFRDRTAPRHPSRMLAQGLVADEEEERWLVSHIRASRDAVVAAIGGRVLAWKISSNEVKKKGMKANGGRLSARQERFKANMDLQYQVRESLSALSAESAARLERHQEEHRLTTEFGLPPTLENMTEQEAVAFAMMLSLDEQETRQARETADEEGWERPPEEWLEGDDLFLDEDYDRSGASTTRMRDLGGDDDDEQEDDAGAEERESSATSRGASRSQSLSVSPSPYLRGASLPSGSSPSFSPRNLSHTWTPVSPSLRGLGSPASSFNPHGKVQISPRLGPTYGSAGAAFVNEPVPDMSPELWPTACSPSSPPSLPQASSFATRRTSTTASSPLVPASTPSPLLNGTVTSATPPASSGAGTPVRRGWSDVARSAAATPAASSSNSPSLSPSMAPRGSAAWLSPPSAAKLALSPTTTGAGGSPSLLSEQLRYSEFSAQQDEERRRRQQEEDDMRYAIELSLAEEASRLAI